MTTFDFVIVITLIECSIS